MAAIAISLSGGSKVRLSVRQPKSNCCTGVQIQRRAN